MLAELSYPTQFYSFLCALGAPPRSAFPTWCLMLRASIRSTWASTPTPPTCSRAMEGGDTSTSHACVHYMVPTPHVQLLSPPSSDYFFLSLLLHYSLLQRRPVAGRYRQQNVQRDVRGKHGPLRRLRALPGPVSPRRRRPRVSVEAAGPVVFSINRGRLSAAGGTGYCCLTAGNEYVDLPPSCSTSLPVNPSTLASSEQHSCRYDVFSVDVPHAVAGGGSGGEAAACHAALCHGVKILSSCMLTAWAFAHLHYPDLYVVQLMFCS